MQRALEVQGLDVQFLAVNQAGYEDGLAEMAAEAPLPLLQDEPAVDAWARWGVTYRDVWVLDGDLRPVGVLNLTMSDLSTPAAREALEALVRLAAGR